MADLTDIQKELQKFGLSKAQAQIYVLLVEHKELRIQEIVRLAKIPRSSVYENLKKLYEFGIAEEVIGESFKKIRPYSIGTMRHGLDESILRLKRLTTDLEALEKTIALAPPDASAATTAVRYYKGRSGARQLFWNTLKATTTLNVYSEWGRGTYVGIKFYQNFVSESYARNFQEHVLTNPLPCVLDSIRHYTGTPISRAKLDNIRMIGAEHIPLKGETFMYDNIYAQVFLKNDEITGFEIESQQFVDTQRAIFETLWENAQPVVELL